jgi:hypothetical protein
MTDNVIRLPRPRLLRTGTDPLAFFVRVGRNDHKEILELISAGEHGPFGFIIEAHNADRHKDLITEARKRDFDVILDPKTQQLAMPGSFTESLAVLPWARTSQHQSIADFVGGAAETRIAAIVEFARHHNFTQILGPTHLLSGPNDPWLRRDIDLMSKTAREIERSGGNLGLIYSLAVPIAVFRDDSMRDALIAAIGDAVCDSLWLKVENFGDDATGEKAAAYIQGCQAFHPLGLPLVADHVGGLPGLGVLAFGAVGGIAHGVTMNQSFRASNWRRPYKASSGGIATRIYLPQLDMLVSRAVAEEFISSSQRIRARHVCKDSHCCGRGMADMLDRPARHAIYQRSREVESLSSAPASVRTQNYLDSVRRVSDEVARAAAYDKLGSDLRRILHQKQKNIGHFRNAMAHLAKKVPDTLAIPPLRFGAASGTGR